ncbi:hypothetical protein BTJ40_10685 [Microbulbifer sp. A4B17]|nr:hypothetical protein BTJ40_10685 [Microbulbifer sp. A4B17]
MIIMKSILVFLRELFSFRFFLSGFFGLVTYSVYFFRVELGRFGWIPLIILVLWVISSIIFFVAKKTKFM